MIKIEHFPYLVIDSAWGSTLNIFNSGFNTEKVKISFRRDQRKEEINISINPNARFVFTESDINIILGANATPFSVSIMSNELITMLCGMYLKDSSGIKFFNIMPSAFLDNKPSCLYSGNGMFFDMTKNNYAYKFYGAANGCYLAYKHGCIVDYCLSKDFLNNEFPLVIGDCCRSDAMNLDGHPGSSHSGVANNGGKAMDINYPRYDGQYTQYRPDGTMAISIFSADGLLLSNYFNHKRFYDFCIELKYWFPDSQVRVDQRIKDFLTSTYGNNPMFMGDYPEQYSHHMHAHIDLGANINI